MPSSSAFSRLMMTSAAAPSLIPDALPAVTVPFLFEGGAELFKALNGRIETRMLVHIKIVLATLFFDAYGDDFVLKATALYRILHL